jgi:16S rRNA (uracil1498-N3)-methyltransferase
MPRFHLPPSDWPSATLRGDEAKHLSQVLRIKSGETITVFDGHGRRAPAEILTVSRDQVSLRIGDTSITTPPVPVITLAQAIPKGKNMDLIVQKAVELGVAAIQPLVTANTIVHPGEGKSDKWRRTALEACKQCGQDTLPHIADPLPFDRWLASLTENASLRLIASLAPGARPFRETLQSHADTAAVTMLIGPEGDFTATEIATATAAGFLPVTLGSIILRVETATLFCVSALRYEFAR